MPRVKTHGDRIVTASLGSRLIKQIPAAKTVCPPIQAARYARNGLLPDIALINSMNEQTNQSVLYRTKEVCRIVGTTAGSLPPSSASATRARWRFAFHSSKYAHALKAVVCLIPQDSNPGNNTYARLDIANSAGTVISTANFYHGVNQGGTATTPGGWSAIKVVEMFLDSISPDTDYYGTFYDIDSARLLSASVYELTSMTENFSGYLPQNLAAGSDVLDVYRQNLTTLQYWLWRRGGATALNWTIDGDDVTGPYGTGPITITGTTATNIVDTTSTTVSAATPGWTLDMTHKNRITQTNGFGMRMECYGKMDVASTTGGRVYLKNSAGTTVASIVDQWTSTTAAWKSTTFNMLHGTDKYDLQFARAGTADAANPFTLYAVSIYEYET